MTPGRWSGCTKSGGRLWNTQASPSGIPGQSSMGVHCATAQPGTRVRRFDFKKAFGRPVKILNDAAMQALGIYKGGRMLFLGLGTGLGPR